MLDLAILMGVADSNDDANDNAPKLPEDPATRQLLIRAINSGLADMRLSNDSWSWMTPTITVEFGTTAGVNNLRGDISRVRLPGYCNSGFIEQPRVVESESQMTRPIEIKTVAEIESLLAADTTRTGYPVAIAIVPERASNSGDQITTSMVVWPKPDRSYKVIATVRIAPRIRFTSLGEALPLGIEHMETVKWAAAYKLQCESPRSTGPDKDAAQAEYARLLALSINLDKRLRPANLGSIDVDTGERWSGRWSDGNPTAVRVMLDGGGYVT